MWYSTTALQRRGQPLQYPHGLALSGLGNFVGALFFAFVFTYTTQAVSEEPYRSGIVGQVTSDIIDPAWHCIFLRALGCGFLVTLTLFLGTQSNDGVSKAMGLHLPFFISVTARFPHTVKYMSLASLGMMLGAELSVAKFLESHAADQSRKYGRRGCIYRIVHVVGLSALREWG